MLVYETGHKGQGITRLETQAVVTAMEGYKGMHKAGSRKGTLHELYDKEGPKVAFTRGKKMGLSENSLRSWFSGVARQIGTEARQGREAEGHKGQELEDERHRRGGSERLILRSIINEWTPHGSPMRGLSCPMPEPDPMVTAVHEAGHAVVARALAVEVIVVSLDHTRTRYRVDSNGHWTQAVIALSGPAAETLRRLPGR
jgi:hypothetical protein